jgi:hypothetical protein
VFSVWLTQVGTKETPGANAVSIQSCVWGMERQWCHADAATCQFSNVASGRAPVTYIASHQLRLNDLLNKPHHYLRVVTHHIPKRVDLIPQPATPTSRNVALIHLPRLPIDAVKHLSLNGSGTYGSLSRLSGGEETQAAFLCGCLRTVLVQKPVW